MAAFCSGASYASVKLNPAEETILKNAGFEIKDSTYSADPEAISTKAEQLLDSANKGYADLSGKVSYVIGFGEVGRNSELAVDLKKVAEDVKARGDKGSTTEAPSIDPKGFGKVTSAFAYGISFLSHSAASAVGKTYRTV